MASPKSIARLEAAIRRRAAHCLQFEVSDPRAEFITITQVQLTTDLSLAKIHWSVLDETTRKKCEHMLESATGFIQRQVSGVLRVRRTPKLKWFYDDSIAEAARVDRLIMDARRKDDELAATAPRELADVSTRQGDPDWIDEGPVAHADDLPSTESVTDDPGQSPLDPQDRA